jgi:radical SAM protein with 4Fe4S-binding SPASM domain
MKENAMTEDIINPETVYFHLTERCTLKCIYCYISAGEIIGDELSTDEIIALLGDIIKLNPKKLVFTGGEPLLRGDIFDLANRFKSLDRNKRIGLYINTNGTLITRDIAHKLIESFDEIRISLDGPEEINDALRGKGTFDRVMQAIDYIQEAGGDPTISITLTSKNISRLKELMSFLLSVKWIHNIHIAPFKCSGRGKWHKELLCAQEDAGRVVAEFWHEYFGFSTKQSIKNRNNLPLNCGVGKYLTVYPDGSVYPCHLLALPEFCIGNIRDKGLFEIFTQSELMNTLRALDFREIANCNECFNELSKEGVCFGEVYQENRAELYEGIFGGHRKNGIFICGKNNNITMSR